MCLDCKQGRGGRKKKGDVKPQREFDHLKKVEKHRHRCEEFVHVCGEKKALSSAAEKKVLQFPNYPLGSSSVVIHLAAFFSIFNDGRSNQ